MKKFLILSFMVLLFINGRKIAARELQQISMVIGYIPHVQFTPLYVGMKNKIFEKYGIRLNIEYGFGIDAFSMLLNRKIDCTLSDSDQLIIARARGLKLKAFFQYYQHYPVSIVALGRIEKPEDLIGKKIGVPELFGTNYIGTKVFLEQHQLTQKVKLIKIGYTQISSLLTGKIDAAACFYNNEPILLQLQKKDIVEWKVKDYSNLVGASFISSSQLLDEKKILFQNFKQALAECITWTVSHQNEALEIAYAKIKHLKKEDRFFWQQVLAKTCHLFYSQINEQSNSRADFGNLNAARYQETIDILHQLKIIPGKINFKELLYP